MNGAIAPERHGEDRQEHDRRESARTQAFLLDWSDRVRGEASPEAIMAITLEALGRHLGVSRTT